MNALSSVGNYHHSRQYRHDYDPVIFFFNDTATTEIYTLSLHDALPISPLCEEPPMLRNGYPTLISLNNSAKLTDEMLTVWSRILHARQDARLIILACMQYSRPNRKHFIDRKSTRLNSSHTVISYAVFCL